MLIQCTKALLDKMKIGPGELRSPEGYDQLPRSLLAWHANIVNIDRRKAIVLMNNATRYPVVIYRPKPKDFARMRADSFRDTVVSQRGDTSRPRQRSTYESWQMTQIQSTRA